MKKLNVLFFPLGPIEVPSSRYRVYQFLAPLRAHGVGSRVRLGCPSAGLLDRVAYAARIGADLVWADVVFLQKAFPPPKVMRLIRASGKPVVFDLDDTIWSENTSLREHRDEGREAKGKRFLEAIGRECDLVIAGNDYLASIVVPSNPRVVVLPTVLDTDLWCPGAGRESDIVTIGWIGTRDNLYYLKALDPVFRALGKSRNGRVVLKIICDRPYEVAGGEIEVVNEKWALKTEVELLASCDIGIMPLTDDEWTRGKCGFKVIQYMAMGMPAVASAVGANREIVDDAINGFLVSSVREWFERLSQLIESRDLRDTIGRAARAKIVAQYSVRGATERFVSVLEQAAGR